MHQEADVGIITGSIRTDHDVEAAHEMRESCKAIIAFGTCPAYGGPQSAAYAHGNEELFEGAYKCNPTTTTHDVPSQVPKLLPEGNRPLDSEIEVDIYIPGCPPHAAGRRTRGLNGYVKSSRWSALHVPRAEVRSAVPDGRGVARKTQR